MIVKKRNAAFFSLFLCLGCAEQVTTEQPINKSHAVEVSYQTTRINDTLVLLQTKQNVYLRGKLVKTIARVDTLPSPGDSIAPVEVDGNTQMARFPKEYEFFITVK